MRRQTVRLWTAKYFHKLQQAQPHHHKNAPKFKTAFSTVNAAASSRSADSQHRHGDSRHSNDLRPPRNVNMSTSSFEPVVASPSTSPASRSSAASQQQEGGPHASSMRLLRHYRSQLFPSGTPPPPSISPQHVERLLFEVRTEVLPVLMLLLPSPPSHGVLPFTVGEEPGAAEHDINRSSGPSPPVEGVSSRFVVVPTSRIAPQSPAMSSQAVENVLAFAEELRGSVKRTETIGSATSQDMEEEAQREGPLPRFPLNDLVEILDFAAKLSRQYKITDKTFLVSVTSEINRLFDGTNKHQNQDDGDAASAVSGEPSEHLDNSSPTEQHHRPRSHGMPSAFLTSSLLYSASTVGYLENQTLQQLLPFVHKHLPLTRVLRRSSRGASARAQFRWVDKHATPHGSGEPLVFFKDSEVVRVLVALGRFDMQGHKTYGAVVKQLDQLCFRYHCRPPRGPSPPPPQDEVPTTVNSKRRKVRPLQYPEEHPSLLCEVQITPLIAVEVLTALSRSPHRPQSLIADIRRAFVTWCNATVKERLKAREHHHRSLGRLEQQEDGAKQRYGQVDAHLVQRALRLLDSIGQKQDSGDLEASWMNLLLFDGAVLDHGGDTSGEEAAIYTAVTADYVKLEASGSDGTR